MRVIYSTLLLFALWLLLSGHYTPLLISLGFISALGVSLIAQRMRVLDEEGLPLGMLWRLPFISLWLIWEILKSNMGVIRVILNPALAQPRLITLNAGQKTTAGLVTHANFITLTPGTVSIEVDEEKNEILVHGITADFAQGCLDETMDKKVSFLEGVR